MFLTEKQNRDVATMKHVPNSFFLTYYYKFAILILYKESTVYNTIDKVCQKIKKIQYATK